MTGYRALRGVGVAGLVLLLSASVASAAFVYDSQTRSVYGEAGGPLGFKSQTSTAPNFGLFDATTSVTLETYGGVANQRQYSELLPDGIIVIGNTSVNRPSMAGTGHSTTRTLTDITFTVTAPTQVTLEASGTAGGSPLGPAHTISLTGPGTNISWGILDSGMFPNVTGSRSATANLLPGSYRFLVDLSSHNDSQQSFVIPNFNVRLVPEPTSLALLALSSLTALSRGHRGHRGQGRRRRRRRGD